MRSSSCTTAWRGQGSIMPSGGPSPCCGARVSRGRRSTSISTSSLPRPKTQQVLDALPEEIVATDEDATEIDDGWPVPADI